jgi:succinoglycan biosynthesis transport protein ExoP
VDPTVSLADVLALAMVLGLMLGVGLAFTREYMDDTIHTKEDIQAASGGVPVLGLIPKIRGAALGVGRKGRRKKKGKEVAGLDAMEGRLVTGKDPRNPVSEAYRSLRTNITFANPDDPPKILVFTSPMPQDGKSTTAANLAITMSQQGTNVLLVDADMRRGVLNTVKPC